MRYPDGVTYTMVLASAGELIRPQSTPGTYPVLLYHPDLQRVARQLVRADAQGAPQEDRDALAHHLLAVMKQARARPEPKEKATNGSARDVLTKPQEKRATAAADREAAQATRRGPAPEAKPKPPAMPSLFD